MLVFIVKNFCNVKFVYFVNIQNFNRLLQEKLIFKFKKNNRKSLIKLHVLKFSPHVFKETVISN